MARLQLTACPACGDRDLVPLEEWDEIGLRQCGSCGVVCTREHEDPDEIYASGYFSGGQGEFGIDLRHPDWRRFGAFAANRRLEYVERFVEPSRLLDVGCGVGDFLAGSVSRGWDAVGAEPIPEAAAAARERGLDVRTGYLQDVGFERRSFDVVSALHVLEHVTNAVDFLRHLAEWTRPGGVVFIEVPNWGSLNRRGYGARWPQLRPLEHVAHYTPATLAQTLRRAGLDHVRTSSLGMVWPEMSASQQVDTMLGPRHDRLSATLQRLVTSRSARGDQDAAQRPVTDRGRRLIRGTERSLEVWGRGFAAIGVARVP